MHERAHEIDLIQIFFLPSKIFLKRPQKAGTSKDGVTCTHKKEKEGEFNA